MRAAELKPGDFARYEVNIPEGKYEAFFHVIRVYQKANHCTGERDAWADMKIRWSTNGKFTGEDIEAVKFEANNYNLFHDDRIKDVISELCPRGEKETFEIGGQIVRGCRDPHHSQHIYSRDVPFGWIKLEMFHTPADLIDFGTRSIDPNLKPTIIPAGC